MFNKCRRGLSKLDKLSKKDDEISQAITFIMILFTTVSMIGGIIIGCA